MPRLTPLVAAAAPLATTLVPSASAGPRQRADLRVSAVDVAVSGARVTGSFTVRNTGAKRAPSSSTAVKGDGKRVRSIATGPVRAGQQRPWRCSAPVGGGPGHARHGADSAEPDAGIRYDGLRRASGVYVWEFVAHGSGSSDAWDE